MGGVLRASAVKDRLVEGPSSVSLQDRVSAPGQKIHRLLNYLYIVFVR